MAAIDSLLGILELKKADGLVLSSGQVPALLIGGGKTPLTMPALTEGTMQIFLAELLAVEARQALAREGAVEGSHDGGTAGTFQVRAKLADGKTTVTVKKAPPGKGAPASAAAPRPIMRSVPPVAAPASRTQPPAAPPSPQTTFVEGDEGGAPPVSPLIADLVRLAVARGASDVILSSGQAPVLRIGGRLVEVERPPVAGDALASSFAGAVGAARWRDLDQRGSVDLALAVDVPGEHEPVRVRANVFRHAGGLAAALRPIWRELPSLEELHLPATLRSLVDLRNGLVVLAGQTGAGKSTTLAALLEHVNQTRPCHVITLEDPIEYRYPRRRATIHQRELGTHVDSFATGLRAALRENPDIILVGELRDRETMRMALLAGETGHLVLATLHAGSAATAIGRIIDAFDDSERGDVRQQLAVTARAIIAQQLVPSASGERLPVLEIVTVNHAISSQIREGRTHMLGTQIELGADAGMIPMERSLMDLVRAGRITRQAGLDAAPDRAAFERLLEERSPRRPV
jgi:twitching motility protein PilT